MNVASATTIAGTWSSSLVSEKTRRHASWSRSSRLAAATNGPVSTIKELVPIPAADGIGGERSDELEGVDLARFTEQALGEHRRLNALALRTFGETPSSVVVVFHNQASHANPAYDLPDWCRRQRRITRIRLRPGRFGLCIPPEKL
jgi:hypothetical protein